jgi:surface protein
MKKIFLFLSVILLSSLKAMAAEPYALLSDNNTKLTFYYGTKPTSGMSVGPFESYTERGWDGSKTTITHVVFDESMSNCHSITSTTKWFIGLEKLVDITHLDYLNTENVEDMTDMFRGCHSLKSIDVSHFDISNVTDVSWMFSYCFDLKTIYCDISWASVQKSTEMFLSSGSIVGGYGTTYTAGHYDATYAHPFDGGYFTKKPKTYALLSENNTKLTFYYGTKPANGMDVGPFESAAERGWNNYKSSITTVEFDESMVDSDITSTAYWFANLDNLTSFNDRYLNTSSVTDMKYMFSNCHSLTSLDLASGFDTRNVKDMGYMFNNCYNLEAVYNSYNFETWYVKNMGYMFYNCKKLKTIHLRNFRAKNATNLEYMFSYCSSLTTLDLSSFDTGMVATMRNMFYNCTSLTALDLSNFTTPQTADLSEMFYGCSNLQTIYCYNAWNSQIYSSNMFYNCKSLIGGDGTVWSASFVTATFAHPNIGGYFSKKPYALLSEDRTTLTFYYGIMPTDGMNIGPFHRIVSDEWGREWGSASYKITTLIFDESMDNCHNITSTAGWFQNMDKLTTITHLDYLHTENVTDMQNMFAWCQGLKSLDMSHFITAKVTNMKAMFIDCRSLESLNLSTFNTANVTNMEQMFYYCKSLTSLIVSSFNTENVTNMNSMFFGCKTLTSLDVSHFDTSKVTTMDNMFSGCEGLTSLDLCNFNTSKVTNADWMFSGCNNLRTIYCNDTWSTEIGPHMFYGCENLVGGDGTHYSRGNVSAAYAHPNAGGYFTVKREPYALLSDNNTKLTFYYGAKPDEGMDFGPFADTTKRGWNSAATTITTVEFDASMGSYNNITSTAYWFDGFSNLTTITGLGNLKTTNVEDMKSMFAGCEKLNSLDLRTFDTQNVKSFEGFLYECSGLQSIDLSSFDTSNALKMSGMFSKCHNLTTLDLRGFNTSSVYTMIEMFYACFNLTTIFCNDNWNQSTSSKDMFQSCPKLKGGTGFSWDVLRVDAKYANPGNQGYFTKKQIILGDVNDDGKVTPADAIMILYHYFGVAQNGFHLLAADVNGDKSISPADAIGALYIYFGSSSSGNARATQPMTGSSRDPE